MLQRGAMAVTSQCDPISCCKCIAHRSTAPQVVHPSSTLKKRRCGDWTKNMSWHLVWTNHSCMLSFSSISQKFHPCHVAILPGHLSQTLEATGTMAPRFRIASQPGPDTSRHESCLCVLTTGLADSLSIREVVSGEPFRLGKMSWYGRLCSCSRVRIYAKLAVNGKSPTLPTFP